MLLIFQNKLPFVLYEADGRFGAVELTILLSSGEVDDRLCTGCQTDAQLLYSALPGCDSAGSPRQQASTACEVYGIHNSSAGP